MDHQSRLLHDKLMSLSPEIFASDASIHIYYDDPRFTTGCKFLVNNTSSYVASRWCVACEVKEDFRDFLETNGIPIVRVPESTSLR